MKTKFKIGDFIVILAIIFVSMSIFFVTGRNLTSENGEKYVVITVDGKEYERAPLENNDQIINVESNYGTNVIKIENNSVRSIEASCPDQVDVIQGAIYEPGEMIVCLPNRMIVEIIQDKITELDVINK